MINQQSQNFGQANAGGNMNENRQTQLININQYLQQRSQPQQNQAIARHLHAQSNFNGNQQSFSQQQAGQLVNGNVMQGIASAQINQLRAMQQQLRTNIAVQQNRLMQQQQQQQQQQQRQSVQPSLNINQQQQTQQANSADGTGVIKQLFGQLNSINEKLEGLSSPNGQNQSATNQQTHRASPLTTVNSGISSNVAQTSVPVNGVGQPSQPPVAANAIGQQARGALSGNAMAGQSQQLSQRSMPGSTKDHQSQHQQSQQQANATISRLSASEILRRHKEGQTGKVPVAQVVPQKPTQQAHRPNPLGNVATKSGNGAQNTRPATNDKSTAPIPRKQPPANTAHGGGARADSQASRPANPKPVPQAPVRAQQLAGQKVTSNPKAPTASTNPTSRQDPSMITSIRILAYGMNQIVMQLPAELVAEYTKLHAVHRFAIEKTMVFKFENRARHASETSDRTPQAAFFLGKLQHFPPLSGKIMSLAGLKCSFCNHRDSYINGSTSFLDLDNPKSLGLIPHVLEGRRNHMLQCPDCSTMCKEVLAAYVPTAEDIQNLLSFSHKWLLVLKAAYFSNMLSGGLVAPVPQPPVARTEVAEILPITEDSIYEELVSAMEMGTAMGDIRLDDLTDTMDKLLCPVMEVLLSSFELQSNSQTGIELCWKRSSGESDKKLLVWAFEKPFSVDDDFCKRIWDFFSKHCKSCLELSRGMRKLVSSTQLPLEEMKLVGKNWSEYASRVAQNQKATKPKEDVKILCPGYIPTPLEYLPGKKSGTFPLKGDFDDNDVVMIGAYRDFIGNRRFRQTVSQFRVLYRGLPLNKKSFVVDKTVGLIQRRGGSFYSKTGFLAQYEESFAFTQNALENGFPELMHPVFPTDAKSVVWDVEFTRMVDILPDRKESLSRAKSIMIESLSRSRVTSAEPNENLHSNRQVQPATNVRAGVASTRSSDGGKVSLREGQPVDISNLKNRSALDRRKPIVASKRKQDQRSVKEANKRPRNSR